MIAVQEAGASSICIQMRKVGIGRNKMVNEGRKKKGWEGGGSRMWL